MLGSYVKVRVTKPIGSTNQEFGFVYNVNYGRIIEAFGAAERSFQYSRNKEAYILGIKHPVREFEGRVIARSVRPNNKIIWIVAPKSRRYINNDIHAFLDPIEKSYYDSSLDCFYEKSCGAVIFAPVDGKAEFLLIKNKRSVYWGFPKGHIEPGETEKETALREVMEETGLKVEILDDFSAKSDYVIQGKVEKTVTIFLAKTQKTQPVLQKEEIDDCAWMDYDAAMRQLKFDNDHAILSRAYRFLKRKNYIEK